MKRNVLIGFILISLITGLVVSFERYRVEDQSPYVEIVLDYPAFEELQKITKIPAVELLKELKKLGVKSVAIFEKTLDEYIQENNVILITGAELAREYYLKGQLDPVLTRMFSAQADLEHSFLLFTDFNIFTQISELFEKLPAVVTEEGYQDDERGIYVLELAGEESIIKKTLLGFSQEEITLITEAGLKVVPRISDTKERLAILPETLDYVAQSGEISQIIFAGSRVIGYPDRLDKTAEILDERKIRVGMIEPFIGKQLGVQELVVLTGLNMTRVHSLLQGEMEKYSLEKITDRYIRAVKERNIRSLYYRPFLVEKDNVKPMELNTILLTDLTTKLAKNGYPLAPAQPFPNERTSPIWIIILSLGVFAAGLLLLEYFIRLPKWLLIGLFVVAILAVALLSFKGYVLLTRDLLALLAAVVFSSLAIIYGFSSAERLAKDGENQIGQAIYQFLKVIGITLVGVVLVIGLLSDVRYMYQINQFRGIKLSFLLPLIIVVAYYFKHSLGVNQGSGYLQVLKKIPTFLRQPVRYSHIVVIGIIGLAGLIYIGRTGNFPLLPVTSIEIQIRDWLEDLLVFRPRFKEFAIGHPFMILSMFYLLKKERRGLALPLIIIGSIGQLTIINTFSHIHTPIMVSALRVLSAIGLGIIGGLILIWLYGLAVKYWDRLRGWMHE